MQNQTIAQKIKSNWTFLINLGVTKDLSYEEIRITHLLNLFALAAIPYSIFFNVINFAQQRWILVFLNFLLLAASAFILFNNDEKKYKAGRYILSFAILIIFSTTAILYENGGEYFLMLNLLATVLLYRKKWQLILFTALNTFSFLIIKYLQIITDVENVVGPARVFFNMGWTMGFIIIILYYFKSENNKYFEEIENKNNLLEEKKKRLETQTRELKVKTRQLEILNKTKEKLFSVVAHDMKSPVSNLKGSLALYNNEIISKEEFALISEQLTTQVDNLYNTLDNLLQWSAGQLNGITVKPGQFQLKTLASETVSLLQHSAMQKNIKIEQHIPEDNTVFADPEQTRVILRNLISNAIKFTKSNGMIAISANKENNHVKVIVKDNGVGMDAATIRSILISPGNLTNRGTNNELGTGLGIALCKEFIEKNHGKLLITSKPEEGTTIEFTLPSEA